MSVKDVIKKSVLESDVFNQAINVSTIATILMNMAAAIIAGLIIYMIYKKFYNGVVYSRNYALTLIGMTVLTCMVTLAISTNIVISLGMVGALSIVRYRTAIKEPIDLLYMFWAITSGITIGASMYILVVIGMVTMFAFIAISYYSKGSMDAYVLMVQYEEEDTANMIMRELDNKKPVLKSKVSRGGIKEMTLQLSVKNNNAFFMEKIEKMEGVKNVTLVQYNGEYHA